MRVGILVLLQILVGRLSAFHCWILFGCVFAVVFIMLRYVPSIPTSLRVFSLNGSWIFIQCFFLHLLRWSGGFSLFFCWCGVSYWFFICWTILVTLGWSHLVVVYDLSYVLLDLIIFFWIFASIFIKDIGLFKKRKRYFLFLVVFVWFWYQGDGQPPVFIKFYWRTVTLVFVWSMAVFALWVFTTNTIVAYKP